MAGVGTPGLARDPRTFSTLGRREGDKRREGRLRAAELPALVFWLCLGAPPRIPSCWDRWNSGRRVECCPAFYGLLIALVRSQPKQYGLWAELLLL